MHPHELSFIYSWLNLNFELIIFGLLPENFLILKTIYFFLLFIKIFVTIIVNVHFTLNQYSVFGNYSYLRVRPLLRLLSFSLLGLLPLLLQAFELRQSFSILTALAATFFGGQENGRVILCLWADLINLFVLINLKFGEIWNKNRLLNFHNFKNLLVVLDHC